MPMTLTERGEMLDDRKFVEDSFQLSGYESSKDAFINFFPTSITIKCPDFLYQLFLCYITIWW
jgi:hypothetical protein